MGQKVHPYGFRLGSLYGWQSNWFAERHYAANLHEDLKIRKYIKKKLYHAGIARVVIDRAGEKIVLNIHTARPGILIGKRGAEVEVLRADLGNLIGNTVGHEIGHSLGLANIDGEFHNVGDSGPYIMDAGVYRPFEERAEIDGLGPAVFSPTNREYLEAVLPVAL